MRGSEKPFKIRGVLARKTLHELEMYRTIPYTCSKKFEPKICPTCRRDVVRCTPARAALCSLFPTPPAPLCSLFPIQHWRSAATGPISALHGRHGDV